MTETQHDKAANTPQPVRENQDVKDLKNWLNTSGRPVVSGLLVAAVLLVGFYIWKGWQDSRDALVQAQLFQSVSPDDLFQVALDNANTKSAPLALALSGAEFYAQQRYEDSMDAYNTLVSTYPEHTFRPAAQMGVAVSEEALGRYTEALERYRTFIADFSSSVYYPQAIMGAARCLEALGQVAEARAMYEDFIVQYPDNAWVSQAESGLQFLEKESRALQRAIETSRELSASAPIVATMDDGVMDEGAAVAAE